jgi:hypothetical protein
MPQKAWSNKRERQYKHVKDSEKKRGVSTKRAKEIAARTVNKERARTGEARTSSRPRTGRTIGRTKEQLYGRAKRMKIAGRSKMNKAQLQRAVDRHK